MADSILGHETYKKSLEYLSYLIIRKQRLLDPYQKNSESNLKRLLLAKVGTIWASKRIMSTDIDKMYLMYKFMTSLSHSRQNQKSVV